MKRLLTTALLLVLLFSASSCTYWYKPCKSFDTCKYDLQQCACEMRQYSNKSQPSAYEVDFVKDCMKQKGYKLVTENKLPRCVKRRGPRTETFWLMAGTSGTIDGQPCQTQCPPNTCPDCP